MNRVTLSAYELVPDRRWLYLCSVEHRIMRVVCHRFLSKETIQW